MASAAPSVGSVPAPSSSTSTRVPSAEFLTISTMLRMWELNVDRLCSMLCSSPMSAKMFSNTGTLLFSAAGMKSPACAIRHSSPTVLSVTVLPPVLGPVMTSVSQDWPISTSMGTTFFLSMSGCLAFLRFT